jgi:two-component system NtrC family sensor kinase
MNKPDESKIPPMSPDKAKQSIPEDTAAERMQAKEALRISEENFLSLISHNADGVVILYSHTTVFANNRICKITGYSQDEILGKHFMELVAPEYHELLKTNYEMKLVDGEPNALDLKIIARDDRKVDVEMRGQAIVFKGKAATMVIIRDITERKQAEDALKLSEQNFRNSMDSSAIGIRISDNHDRTSYVNKAFLDIFGYRDIDEVRASPPPEHYSPEAHAGWVLRHEKLLRGEPMPKQVDIPIIHKDGTIRHLDVSMKEVLWNGKLQNQTLYNDITEQKQAELALKLSEQNFRSSMDSSAIGIRISDNNDHTAYVNKVFLDIFGYKDIDEVMSNPPQEHYSPEARAAWVLRHEKLLRGEPMPKQVVVDIIRKDGTVRYLTVSMADVYWDGAQRYQTLYNDVTESKKMSEKLLVSERFASIGQLSAGIAHELNNPLTSILGFSNMILEKDVPADLKEELQIISTEALRASRILKGLLTFVRKDDSQKVRMNVNRIIESVLELRANEQNANNIRIHTRLDRGLPEIMADPFQIQQVFLNIVINAEYFMIEAHKQGNLTISTHKSGDMARIVFTDDGPGIAPENLKHVFDPFYTTKGVGKGTGLGLSICHGIVSAHGGRIYAESTEAKGTSFIVELPFQ